MTTKLISKPVIEKTLNALNADCLALKEKGIVPNLHVFLVGDHLPSQIYTRNKKKFCEKIGARCKIISLPGSTTEQDLLSKLDKSNNDEDVDGIIIQLPLPKHLNHLSTSHLVVPEKDIDGFHPENIYKLMDPKSFEKTLISCTPKGIISLLNFYDIPIKGQNIVIIGRSLIVGRPLSMLLTSLDASVTLCHSKTKNIKTITRQADIIITAIGKESYLTKDFIGSNKPIIVDVGINRNQQGLLCGDVCYEEVYDLCKGITPVPGGVGPMTILSLAQNLIQASQERIRK